MDSIFFPGFSKIYKIWLKKGCVGRIRLDREDIFV